MVRRDDIRWKTVASCRALPPPPAVFLTKGALWAVALSLALLVSGLASAYILPGPSILRRTAASRDEIPTSSFRMTATLALSGEAARLAAPVLALPEQPTLLVDAVLSVKTPGRCRLEAVTPAGQPIVAAQSQARKRFEGVEIPALAAAVQEICGVLAVRTGNAGDTRAALDRHLASLKISARNSSLARFSGQVAYVLGDPREGAPQFWVYKEIFQPARVRFADSTGGNWDVRFSDYGSPSAGAGWPRVIEVFRDGNQEVRLTVLTQEPRSSLADKLF